MAQALREMIQLRNLMKEINIVIPLHLTNSKFLLGVHKDNQSCIVMVNNPKFTPRTKYIAINRIWSMSAPGQPHFIELHGN